MDRKDTARIWRNVSKKALAEAIAETKAFLAETAPQPSV